MKRPFLICFVGVDGSGKTANVMRLANWLTRKGFGVKYVWNRFDPFLLKLPQLLVDKFILKGNRTSEAYEDYTNAKGRLLSNPIVNVMYQYVLLVEAAFSTFFRIWSKLLFSEALVICDRYVYDAVVCLADDLNYSSEKVRLVLNLALRLVPKPDLVFLVDVPEALAYNRKGDIPSPAFITRRRRLYLLVGELCRMHRLDGSMSFEELDSAIRPIVAELLN